MDEVIGAGDMRFKEKAKKRIQEIAEHTKIIVLASHSDGLIKKWCNRAIWIEQGQVRGMGAPEEIWERYKKSMVAGK